MSPDAAIQLLIDALNDQDFETACEAGNGYAAWLARGGYHAANHDMFLAYQYASDTSETNPLTFTFDRKGYLCLNGARIPFVSIAAALLDHYYTAKADARRVAFAEFY